MFKSIILTILSLSLILSCSVKNPFSKKNPIIYLDCPKSLILAPGSTIFIDNSSISLNKDYEIECYYNEAKPNQVIFNIDYNVKLDPLDLEEKTYDFELWIFMTDKKETSKLLEFKFEKNIKFDLSEENIANSTYGFQDQIILDRSIYDEGLKIFLSLN